MPAVLEPLLFYLLHRASATIRDRAKASTLKLFVLDDIAALSRSMGAPGDGGADDCDTNCDTTLPKCRLLLRSAACYRD